MENGKGIKISSKINHWNFYRIYLFFIIIDVSILENQIIWKVIYKTIIRWVRRKLRSLNHILAQIFKEMFFQPAVFLFIVTKFVESIFLLAFLKDPTTQLWLSVRIFKIHVFLSRPIKSNQLRLSLQPHFSSNQSVMKVSKLS